MKTHPEDILLYEMLFILLAVLLPLAGALAIAAWKVLLGCL